MNTIEIMLLPSRRYSILNRPKGAVISAEHNATSIKVKFPTEYENYSKRVDFVSATGKLWTEKLYTPEYEEYDSDFDKSLFLFTLPNEITHQGELKMQFIAYEPSDNLTIVPFEIIPIFIEHGLNNFKKNGRHNPDLLVLSYNHSYQALMNSEQSKGLATSADEKSDEALSLSTQALETAEGVKETAQNAKTVALESKGTAAAAAHTADMAYTASGNAIIKADEAISTAEESRNRSIIAQEQAEAIGTLKVDKIQGKSLSAEDYTTNEKNKLAGIEPGAQVNVQSDWAETNIESDIFIKNKPTTMTADGGNADTVDGKHASDFATAEQGIKADNAVLKTRKINDKALSADITLTAADVGAATASQGAKADTALQTETDPTVPAWAKAENKPTYTAAEVGAATAAQGVKADNAVPNTRKVNGKALSADITLTPSDIGAATAGQGAKADTALQSFTETDPTVPAWAKQPIKPTYTPAEIGAATAAQGAKADTALQSFTETDPTVPTWAKASLKPSYNFSEITGLMSALQLPDSLIRGINNVSANFNSATEQWDVSAEIPFIFECNGIDDNERLSNVVKDFYNSANLTDNANLKVVVKGKLGVSNTRLYGSGVYADNYRVFEFGVSGYTGSRRVFLDFSGAEVPEINTIVEGYNYFTVIDTFNIPINIHGLSIIARQTRKEGMSGSGSYLTCLKGNNYNLTDCDITSLNESFNGSFAVVGADCIFNNCSFTVKGSNAVCYAINGDRAKVNNCRFYSLSGDVYTLNSVGAFVQGCHIATIGTSTTQVQCNGKNDCVFINCTLEITGRGTLRCNSGSNCSFINCTFIAESTDVNSTVSANQGSNCYFMNCRLTAKGSYWSSSGVSGNSSSGCVFVASVLKATNTRSDGYAYGARVWNGVMIGCDLLAYVPEGGTGEAIGFHLNSAVTNKCIIIGCRFREVAEEGYEQGPSIVIDGTDTGGEYMITNNIISGEIRTHSLTGGNYIKEPNIMEGI